MECIPAYAFRDKENLKHIVLSPSIKNIEDGAFIGCKNLRICEIKKKKAPNLLPKALNDSVTTVVVPLGSRDEYWNKARWKPFNIVEGEIISSEVEVAEGGTLEVIINESGKRPETINFLTVKGDLNEEDFRFIRDYIPQLVGINLSETKVNEIPPFSFSHKTYLMWIDFPHYLVSIGERAFSSCIHLAGELPLPDTVEFIADDAFQGYDRVK
ncbi:MAG: leucine-rich repeat domain-containing protein, partial [Bacteroides sp.]|nr:leucine-rich repeat domain-containing protein [Bacteroides sp.]